MYVCVQKRRNRNCTLEVDSVSQTFLPSCSFTLRITSIAGHTPMHMPYIQSIDLRMHNDVTTSVLSCAGYVNLLAPLVSCSNQWPA